MRAVAIVVVVGCGGPQHTRGEAADFECKQRSASYTTAHHISGDEIGVLIECEGSGPRIKRWKMDKAGTRLEDAHSISPVVFDQVWAEIEGTGWRNLGNCPPGEKRDPIYQFDIKDETDQKSFSCQQPRMPYPWHDIVDPLDLASQQGRHQLGDDEPADAKALDRKKPKQ
jgi:hypothetical protein